MSNGDKPTVKEHFVPKIYLRGFSPDRNRVYRFDLKKGKAIDLPVDVGSICFKRNLYEVCDQTGNFIFPNFFENKFGKIEGEFSGQREALKQAVETVSDKKMVVMDKDDYLFWIVFTTIQILRNPVGLKIAASAFVSRSGSDIRLDFARAYIMCASFPFFSDSDRDSCPFFVNYVRYLSQMRLSVGYDPEGGIYTSDNPVCCYSKENPMAGFSRIYFPVSSDMVLIFEEAQQLSIPKGITKIDLDTKMIAYINDNVVYNARTGVISKHPFTEEDTKAILEVQNSEQKAEFMKQWALAGIL